MPMFKKSRLVLRTYISLVIILLSFTHTYAQKKYPQNYFINPLDIPITLAGTFGEIRSNHFHTGLDMKTDEREGLAVRAAADGMFRG